MAIIKKHDEGITGGKIYRRRVPFIPYNRPRSAARSICKPPSPPANEAGRSRWFTKKLFDSATQLVVNSVSRLFSVFVKGVAATPGENTGAMEEVSKVPTDSRPIPSSSSVQPTDPSTILSSAFERLRIVKAAEKQPTDPSPILPSQFESSHIVKAAEKQKSSYEVREQGGNSVDIRLSIRYDGSDTSRQELISHIKGIFQLEEQLNQKRFSRSELNKKEDLLLSRTTQQSTLKGVNFNALKRGSSDMDAGCTGDARRIRQKFC